MAHGLEHQKRPLISLSDTGAKRIITDLNEA